MGGSTSEQSNPNRYRFKETSNILQLISEVFDMSTRSTKCFESRTRGISSHYMSPQTCVLHHITTWKMRSRRDSTLSILESSMNSSYSWHDQLHKPCLWWSCVSAVQTSHPLQPLFDRMSRGRPHRDRTSRRRWCDLRPIRRGAIVVCVYTGVVEQLPCMHAFYVGNHSKPTYI